MPSKALSMGKLLGNDGNIPTAKLPTNIQAFDVTEIPTGKLPSNIRSLDDAGMASISSNLTGSGKISIKSLSSNTLTQSFDSNQVVDFALTDSINTNSPLVSVFKEVQQPGVSSKGTWDVNSNGTNYEFLDEKPVSYSSITLTPSATGDGTFTFSSGTFAAGDVGKVVTGNSGSAVITATSGTYKSVTAFADTSAISSWTLTSAEGKADGSGIALSGIVAAGNIPSTFSNQDGPDTIGSGSFNHGYHWSKDGTYYYSINQDNSTIYKFLCTTPWDVATQSAGQTTGAAGSGSKHGITVSEDGKHIYHGTYNEQIVHIPLSTAHDLTSAGSSTVYTVTGTYGSKTVSNANPWDMWVKSDGTKIWALITTNTGSKDTIIQFSMSTPYDVSTASFDSTFTMGSRHRFKFTSDGARLYTTQPVLGSPNIRYWNLSPAFTLPSDGTAETGTISVPGSSGDSGKFFDQYYYYTTFHDDRGGALGVEHHKLNRYTIDQGSIEGSVIHPYNFYSPAITKTSNGQINSATWVDINSMTADETKNDGDIFYAVSTDNRTSWGVNKGTSGIRKIAKNNSGTWQYNNDAGGTAGPDLSAGTQDSTSYNWTNIGQSLGGYGEVLGGMHWKPDGSKFVLTFRAASGSLFMESWSTSTAFSLDSSHVSKDSGYWNPTANSGLNPTPWGNTRSTAMSGDGTKVYICADAGNFFQYSLTTGWDLTSNVSSTGTRINVGAASYFNCGNDRFRAITFGDNGNYVYGINDNELKIYQASLSSAYDLTSTWSNVKSLSVPYTNFSNGSNNSSSFQINSLGDVMIVYWNDGTMQEYSLSTNWDITSASNSSANDISKTYSFSLNNASYFPSMYFDLTANALFYSVPTARTTGTIYKITGIGLSLFGTSETWVNGTTNNELSTLQQALSSQTVNRMDKAQIDAIPDANHYPAGSTLDLMIAPFTASGASPISDGVNINYDAEALIREAQPGVDYIAEFPTANKIKIKSLVDTNLKIRAQ